MGGQDDQITGDVSGKEAVQTQKADGIRRTSDQTEYEREN